MARRDGVMANPMIGSLSKALRRAGVPDDEARLAAFDAAAIDDRIIRVEADLGVINRMVGNWMVGASLAVAAAILARLSIQ